MRQFELWNGDGEINDSSLANYIGFLSSSGRKPACAAQIIAALRKRSDLLSVPDPVGPLTKSVMSGFRRSSPAPQQANGMNWDNVQKICAKIPSDLASIRDKAMILTMSDAMLRVSELVNLNVGDLGNDTILVCRSKTDQNSHGVELFLGPPTIDALRIWIMEAGFFNGPLFRPVLKGNQVERRLSTRQVMRIVKARAESAGLKASSHSFRVGSCQSLAEAGASLVEMQQAGRWRDPKMPAYYSRRQSAKRGAMNKYKYGQAND
ncbi:MAG: tyrosine-type recombinase/integrase [Gammaproteobacteria bacterium]|nr:tyrosine-type recombinase/integrase [Gammaproteobacteria bacterium]